MKRTHSKHLFLTAIASASMMCMLNAQTAPKSTSPEDDTTSLLTMEDSKKNTPEEVGSVPEAKSPESLVDEPKPEITADLDNSATKSAPTQVTADEGIQIQVEKSTAKSGVMNKPGAVKIYSPWPAKPISPAPAGWKFVPAPAGLAPFKTTVKLSSGNTVDLSVTPFVLVPISDGLNAIRIAEPGYDPAQQYAQKETVGTMLQNSTTEIENNEKQAAAAIMQLQQLLSSLPQQQQ